MAKIKEGDFLWEPNEQTKKDSNMIHYMEWLQREKGLDFTTYDELWQWSVDQVADFWESLWEYFDIKASAPYSKVLSNEAMPGAKWFEGAKLNYTEHVFRHMTTERPALITKSELRPTTEISWQQLYDQVAMFAASLKTTGIKSGDRVVAYMPNIPEAIIAFLACASIGVIWSSSSPDFGSFTVVDRFKQIEPQILLAVDGYRYNGKDYNRLETVGQIQQNIPTLEKTIILPYLNEEPDVSDLTNVVMWNNFVSGHENVSLTYEQLPFEHPLWVLFSSGTTGLPKAIVHGQGGIILEHLKFFMLHSDTKENDRFFWYTTTGWMMWNIVVGALLRGMTTILYDGSPVYPDSEAMWRLIDETKMTTFGTSASFILNSMNEGLVPKEKYSLASLRSIYVTASPLPPEGFKWIYDYTKSDVWLGSLSGGTDMCTAFVGQTPLLPVYAGLIQSRGLGAKVEAFDEAGNSIINEVGELVLTKPMPSMPIYFWNDTDGKVYEESYFDTYPGVWRHGDWIKIREDGSNQIYGRSDSTINRGGIRIGTSEIYRAIETMKEIKDSLIIDISNEKGRTYMPLFIVLNDGAKLDEQLIVQIGQRIRENCSPRHVPTEVFEVESIPRTLNDKKMEVPIKRILMGVSPDEAINKGSMQNPETVDYFVEFAKKLK